MNWQKLNDVETYTRLWDNIKQSFRKRKNTDNSDGTKKVFIDDLYSHGLDFLTLIKLVFYHWKLYLACIALSVFLGWIIGKNIPETYTAKVQLAPESNNDASKFGSLSGIASQFGVDMQGQTSDAIVPDLYPTVVNSTKFIVELCDIPVTTKDGSLSTSLYDFCAKHQKPTPWGKWIDDHVKDKSKDRTANNPSNATLNPRELTKEQDDVIEAIKGMLSCNVDQQTSVITIKATTQDPLISAILVDSVSNHLQKFITAYRTSKARHDADDTRRLLEEAKAKYQKVQKTYVEYADAHEDLNLQSYISKRDELENEMQLRYNIYTQLQQQLQVAEAKIQERTPIYAVIEPATVPVKKAGPHTMLIAVALTFVAICTVTAIIIINFSTKSKEHVSPDK